MSCLLRTSRLPYPRQPSIRVKARLITLVLVTIPLLLRAQVDTTRVTGDAVTDTVKRALPFQFLPDSVLVGEIVDTLPPKWWQGGVLQLTGSQVQLTDWAAGGSSGVSGVANLNAFRNLRTGRTAWDNAIMLTYGLVAGYHRHAKKTDDRLELNMRIGRQLKEGGTHYASALVQFRTQFAEGYDPRNDTVKISNFLTPGYLTFAIGSDYKLLNKLSAFISPLPARVVFKNDSDFFNTDAFGVASREITSLQFGYYFNFSYAANLGKNISFLTRADLFGDYMRHPENMDVNWEMLFTFKVNDWVAATLNTLVIYDDDIDVVREVDGVLHNGPTLQFKETFGLGMTMKF